MDSEVWSADVAVGRGGVTRVTNDLSNYRRITLSGDGKTLSALQTRRDIDLWVAPVGAPTSAARIAPENVRGMNSVAWAPHDRIFLRLSAAPGGISGRSKRPASPSGN